MDPARQERARHLDAEPGPLPDAQPPGVALPPAGYPGAAEGRALRHQGCLGLRPPAPCRDAPAARLQPDLSAPMTVCAIMQPTYLPWIGYFALMDMADVFVFLDDVQLSKQSWQTRNRIKGESGKGLMLTVPIRHAGEQAIRDVEIDGAHWA